MRAALVQMTGTDDPAENLSAVLEFVDQAVAGGAQFIATPEVTNCISSNPAHQAAVLSLQAQDPVLAGLRGAAQRHGVWVLIGSLALKTDAADGRLANRSFLIDPSGSIAAWYDKIHMFDVMLSKTETYRESDRFDPGARAVVAPTPLGALGLSICYDLRFAGLFRRLAQSGAQVLTVPAAFTVPTGRAHWEVLLRARAIETGCFVLAPAQTGRHTQRTGRMRETWGHSLAVDPWGTVIADGGREPGVTLVTLDLADVEIARGKVPALQHDRAFEGPEPV